MTVATARERLQRELDLLGAGYVTLSTNVELRLDGQPISNRASPSDCGVALYFRLGGKSTAIACDRWNRVADNIVAIAKHIEALRGMDRWGVGTAAQAFAGYQALPPATPWQETLGLTGLPTLAEIDAAYRRLARTSHPDAGGSRAEWDRLVAAYEQAKAVRS